MRPPQLQLVEKRLWELLLQVSDGKLTAEDLLNTFCYEFCTKNADGQLKVSFHIDVEHDQYLYPFFYPNSMLSIFVKDDFTERK